MKKLVVLLVLLGVASMASATYDWYGPAKTSAPAGVSQDWFTAANWNSGVPVIGATPTGVRTYGGSFYASSLTTAPIIATGNARSMEVRVSGTTPDGSANGMGYLIMNSGTLRTMNFLMIGGDSGTGGGRAGTMYMHGGTATLGGGTADGLDTGSRASGHLYVGHGTGTCQTVGQLFMDGGVVDAGGDFAIGKNQARGSAYLSGNAVIKANNFLMRPDNVAATAYMDVSGMAQVIINGDRRGAIAGYLSNGWITADGGEGSINYWYSAATGKTTINVPEPATMCLLGLGALSLIRRKK